MGFGEKKEDSIEGELGLGQETGEEEEKEK